MARSPERGPAFSPSRAASLGARSGFFLPLDKPARAGLLCKKRPGGPGCSGRQGCRGDTGCCRVTVETLWAGQQGMSKPRHILTQLHRPARLKLARWRARAARRMRSPSPPAMGIFCFQDHFLRGEKTVESGDCGLSSVPLRQKKNNCSPARRFFKARAR